MSKRIHVIFSGQVQGVGFRRTSSGWAQALGLRGWVQNLPDGRVEMEAEGPESKLIELLGKLRKGFSITKEEKGKETDEVLPFPFDYRK